MKRYIITERRENVSKEDIKIGCTLVNNGLTKEEFNTAEEAINKLRSDEYYQKSNVIRNFVTNPTYEVIEFFVEVEELEEDGYHIFCWENEILVDVTDATRKVLAISDMPEETDKFNWRDTPDGF